MSKDKGVLTSPRNNSEWMKDHFEELLKPVGIPSLQKAVTFLWLRLNTKDKVGGLRLANWDDSTYFVGTRGCARLRLRLHHS